MVYRRNDDNTGGWHEPPYTEEEEFEFYRRISEGMASGQATIYRGQKPAGKQAPAERPLQEAQWTTSKKPSLI